EVDALEQLAVGDAGGGEEAVVAADQVVGGEHPLEVVVEVESRLPLLVVAGPQPALELAPHALEGGGGDHPLGGAPDAEQDVGPRLGPRGRDGAGQRSLGG